MSSISKTIGKGVHTPPRDRDVLLVQQLLNMNRPISLGKIMYFLFTNRS